MKIIKNNSNQLILCRNPYYSIIFGLIFILTGLGISYAVTRSISLHCEHVEKNRITCELSKKLLDIIPIGQHTIVNIRKASVEESNDIEDDMPTYRVIFITANGNVPLISFYSSGYGDKAKIAKQINNFINTEGNDTLDIKIDYDLWTLIYLFGFSGSGIFAILSAKRVTFEMNHSEGILCIRKVSLLSSNQEKYLLREIEDVYLQTKRVNEDLKTYRVTFRTTSDEDIPLNPAYTWVGIKGMLRTIKIIKDFLGIHRHHQEGDPLS